MTKTFQTAFGFRSVGYPFRTDSVKLIRSCGRRVAVLQTGKIGIVLIARTGRIGEDTNWAHSSTPQYKGYY